MNNVQTVKRGEKKGGKGCCQEVLNEKWHGFKWYLEPASVVVRHQFTINSSIVLWHNDCDVLHVRH